MSRRPKVGMVGGGYFGRFHINAWLRLTEVEFAGVVVRDAVKRAELESLYPEATFFTDLESLLARHPDLDMLDVATPPESHADIIRPHLGRLPWIICQKPFCRNLGEARALTAMAEAKGTHLVVHENFRFMPWYRKFAGLIAEGTLGEVRQAHFRMRPGDGNGDDAYLARQPYFRTMERFLIHETGIHWIDVFRFLFGEPAHVYCDMWRTNPVIAGEDSGLVLFSWESGLRAIYDGNRTLDHSADNHRLTMGEFLVEGSKATARLDGRGNIHVRNFGDTAEQKVEYDFEDTDFGGDCVYHFQNHVVNAFLKGTAVETLARNYLRNIEIEEAVYRSASQGGGISLT